MMRKMLDRILKILKVADWVEEVRVSEEGYDELVYELGKKRGMVDGKSREEYLEGLWSRRPRLRVDRAEVIIDGDLKGGEVWVRWLVDDVVYEMEVSNE